MINIPQRHELRDYRNRAVMTSQVVRAPRRQIEMKGRNRKQVVEIFQICIVFRALRCFFLKKVHYLRYVSAHLSIVDMLMLTSKCVLVPKSCDGFSMTMKPWQRSWRRFSHDTFPRQLMIKMSITFDDEMCKMSTFRREASL